MRLSRSLPLLAIVVACPCLARAEHPTQTGSPRAVLVGDYEKRLLAVVDADNSVRWQHPIRAIHDAQLLENGNVLFQTSFRECREVTPDGRQAWRYEAPEGAEIHAFRRLPNGLTMVAESGQRRIIEVDHKGRIQHEIPLQVDNPDPHRDTRLVRPTPEGNYLVAHEGDAVVREYDRSGRVLWTYDAGTRLYAAVRLENGNTLIGTGDGHRAIEVDPQGQVVWSIEEQELPGIQLVWVAMVQRLANGNTVIVNCHAGPENPQMIEVTPEKQVVWTFHDFDRFGNSLPVGVALE